MPNISGAVKTSNEFGMNVFEEIRKSEKDQNTFYSPISTFFAFSMLYNGASGETKKAMEEAMHLSANRLYSVYLNYANDLLMNELQAEKEDFTLTIANSLWVKDNFKLVESFVENVTQAYKAQISVLDFLNPMSADIINGWIKEKTHDKIPEVVNQELLARTLLLLINATYFKGDWTIPFPKYENITIPVDFQKFNGQVETKEGMSNVSFYRYKNTNDYEAIELTYGREPSIQVADNYVYPASMIVFLPKKDLNAFETKYVNKNKLEEEISSFDNVLLKYGSLKMPKFKFEASVDLKAVLKNLGMNIIFSPYADFRGLTKEKVTVTDAFQKTFVAVDEKGTEAAAVTVIGVGRPTMPRRPEFNMTVDRPFFFVIKDNRYNSILFAGSIVDPKIE
jgi:serpin B